MSFRVTYATMFDPPAAMHERFDAALAMVRSQLGARHELFVNGSDLAAARYAPQSSPIDGALDLGEFPVAGRGDVEAAMRAARGAFPAWRATPVAERVRLMRRVADSMERRVYEIAAALNQRKFGNNSFKVKEIRMITKLMFGRTGQMSTRVLLGAAALGRVTQKEADATLEMLIEYWYQSY